MSARPIDRIYERRLLQRNEALKRYLALLDRQSRVIEDHDLSGLDGTFLLERDLLFELESLAAVIRTIGGHLAPVSNESERKHLEDIGTELLEEVKARNTRVRQNLRGQIDDTGRRLKSVNVPRRGRSVFRSERDSGSMVDLSG